MATFSPLHLKSTIWVCHMHQFSNFIWKTNQQWPLDVKLMLLPFYSITEKSSTTDDYLQMPYLKLQQHVTCVSRVCNWLELCKGRWLPRQKGTTSSTVDFGWSPIFQSICQLWPHQQLVLAASKFWRRAFSAEHVLLAISKTCTFPKQQQMLQIWHK